MVELKLKAILKTFYYHLLSRKLIYILPFSTADNNNISDAAEKTASKAVTVGVFVAYNVIMLVSLLGNSLIIHIVFSRPRRTRTATNYQLVNMACADLFITVLSMPFYAYFICVRREWLGGVAGDVICKVAAGTSIMSVLASTLTLVIMAVDRFLAVFFPLRRIRINRKTKVITLAVWAMSMLFGAPSLYMYSVREEGGRLNCLNNLERTNLPLRRAYYLMIFGLMFALPTTVMSVMYSMVAYKLWFRKIPGNQTSAARRVAERTKRKIVRMLIVIMLAFTACWLPVYIEWFLEVFNSKARHEVLAIMLAHANSALNPCLYFLLNDSFRRQLVRTFKACCCHRDEQDGVTSESQSRNYGFNEQLMDQFSNSLRSASPRCKNYRLAEVPKAFTPVTLLYMTNDLPGIRGENTSDEEQRTDNR